MDEIEFPSALIDRVIGRRGRLHLYERFEPERTALLVVDLQVHFMQPGSPSEVPSARGVVPRVNRLAGALRARGGQVVWVVSTYGPDEGNRWSNLFDRVLSEEAGRRFREGLSEGSPGHALWPELDVRAADPVVAKNRFGGFMGSGGRLEQTLRGRGIDTVLIAGTVTNVCCESTAREAAALDFKTVMIADANGGRSDREDIETYSVCIASYGDVMTSAEAIERLGAS